MMDESIKARLYSCSRRVTAIAAFLRHCYKTTVEATDSTQSLGAGVLTFPGCLQLLQGLQGSTEGATISIRCCSGRPFVPGQFVDRDGLRHKGTFINGQHG